MSKELHPGQPTKKSPEMLAKIEELIGDGLTQEQASAAVGISRKTLIRWRQDDPELEDRLISAREKARSKALANIKAAGERGDWRASESFLRLSFWNEYRDRGTQVNVNAPGIQLICDEATRQRLIALRKEILQPKPVEAIEVEVQPLGLPSQTQQPFKPAEPLSEAELAEREKIVEKLEREAELEAARQEQENCLVEPHGLDIQHLKDWVWGRSRSKNRLRCFVLNTGRPDLP